MSLRTFELRGPMQCSWLRPLLWNSPPYLLSLTLSRRSFMTCSMLWLPTMLLKNVRHANKIQTTMYLKGVFVIWKEMVIWKCQLSVCFCMWHSGASRRTCSSGTWWSRPLPDTAGCWWWCLPAVSTHAAGQWFWLPVCIPYQCESHRQVVPFRLCTEKWNVSSPNLIIAPCLSHSDSSVCCWWRCGWVLSVWHTTRRR